MAAKLVSSRYVINGDNTPSEIAQPFDYCRLCVITQLWKIKVGTVVSGSVSLTPDFCLLQHQIMSGFHVTVSHTANASATANMIITSKQTAINVVESDF